MFLFVLISAAAPARAHFDPTPNCARALAELRSDVPGVSRTTLDELAWTAVGDALVARPLDPDLHDRVSLRLEKSPMTRAWNARLVVAPQGFEAWIAVSHAFESMQTRRFFRVGFSKAPRPLEIPKGILAIFEGDAPADEADVEDGFEVLARVFAALRGHAPKPSLN